MEWHTTRRYRYCSRLLVSGTKLTDICFFCVTWPSADLSNWSSFWLPRWLPTGTSSRPEPGLSCSISYTQITDVQQSHRSAIFLVISKVIVLRLLQPVYGPLSGTARVSRYQEKHSPTDLCRSSPNLYQLVNLLRSIASSLFSLHATTIFFAQPLSKSSKVIVTKGYC